MQKVLNLTNKYIVLATPLILYSLISSVYMVASATGGKVINILFAIILFTLMTGAFIAGWFHMIKLAINNQDDDNPNALIKEFIGGVGEYFLPALGSFLVMFIIASIILTISYFIGINTIGDIGISSKEFSEAIKNTADLKAFLSSLSIEQLTKINLWNMLMLGTMTLVYFLFFLYMPALFFKNKNPFIAYFISLKDLFSKKILTNIGIFLLIFIINFLISLFSTILGGNIIAHFILTLLNFYFITAVGVGIFYYYNHNFVEPLIGQNIDTKI